MAITSTADPAKAPAPPPSQQARTSPPGGTLAGVGMFLEERCSTIKIALAYPMGAAMLRWVFELLRGEGFCVGGSTGINVAGAVRLALELGPAHTIVTMLCDGGIASATRPSIA